MSAREDRMADMADGMAEPLALADAVNDVCQMSGKPIAADSLTRYRGFVVGFCNPGCRDTFAKAIHHFEAALAGYEPVDPDETPE
jgi:hypothetical protein